MFNSKIKQLVVWANSHQFIRNKLIFFAVWQVWFCLSMFVKQVWILNFDFSVADGLILLFPPQADLQLDTKVRVISFCVNYRFCFVPLVLFAHVNLNILIFKFNNIFCVVMVHWCFLFKFSSKIVVATTFRTYPSLRFAVLLFTWPSLTVFSHLFI